MKTITKFVAVDGAEFTDEIECINYEALIEKVRVIMSPLKTRPDDTGFSNGGGYIQHDPKQVRAVQIELLKEAKNHISHRFIDLMITNDDMHESYVIRIFNDYGIRPICDAWYKFACIDKRGREYGQPYFVYNPDKAPTNEIVI